MPKARRGFPRRTWAPRRSLAATLAFLAPLLVAACDASERNVESEGDTAAVTAGPDTTAATTATAADTSAADTTAGVSETVEVTLTEFSIDMPRTLAPGAKTFRVTNAGGMEHNIEIEMGGTEYTFPETLAPGETRTLEARLEAGTWEVYCPVADHADRGMRLQLRVG